MPNHPKNLFTAASLLVALATGSLVLPADGAERRLSNGCRVTARGIPGCGAYAGGAYGANSDVRPWEQAMGRKIGVHRTYFQASQVDGAVRTAHEDARNKRVPWISFKAPYSWRDMASGRGDAWAKEIARRMAGVPGPVWVAVHHEPENDYQDVRDWTRMQERLGPILRDNARNLGFSVIVMGWHQFFGDDRYRLRAMWPDTKVDIAGFDIYEEYGTYSGRRMKTEWKSFRRDYFRPISRWARSEGVAWGLAETGITDSAARERPRWMVRKYRSMKEFGGVAFAYFNTYLNNIDGANWSLTTAVKKRGFARVNKRGVRLD